MPAMITATISSARSLPIISGITPANSAISAETGRRLVLRQRAALHDHGLCRVGKLDAFLAKALEDRQIDRVQGIHAVIEERIADPEDHLEIQRGRAEGLEVGGLETRFGHGLDDAANDAGDA